jgi:hypothetical protein
MKITILLRKEILILLKNEKNIYSLKNRQRFSERKKILKIKLN